MLKSKVFVKKTRKGKILKIVREHYLRDDIWSGTTHIPLTDTEPCKEKNFLETNPLSRSSLCRYPHYLLPDTNVILHQVKIKSNKEFMKSPARSILRFESIYECKTPVSLFPFSFVAVAVVLKKFSAYFE